MAEAESTSLKIKEQIDGMATQFKAALPPHISVEKFIRVTMTAVNNNPKLAQADRRSLMIAATQCAQDGLLPDGHEAAFTIFKTKQGDHYIEAVKYMPMVWGIVKKVRNSGELSEITSHVVHANDAFDYSFGDNEGITHKPKFGDRGAPIGVYAIVKTRDGAIYREYMSAEEVNEVKEISKAKDSGPWAGPFYLEMWKKTVIRRLAKRLPMSTDVERLVTRDDDLYDLNKPREVAMPRELEPPPTSEETRGTVVHKAVEEEIKKEEKLNKPKAEKAEKSKPQGKVDLEALITEISEATAETWEEVKKRAKDAIKDIKSSDDQLKLTHAINNKNKEFQQSQT